MQVVADTAVAAACIVLKEEEPCEVAAVADTSWGREAEVFDADAAGTAVGRETIHKELVCIVAEAEAETVVCIAFADLGPFGRELEREGKE